MAEWTIWTWALHLMFSVGGFILFDAKRRNAYDHQFLPMYICTGMFASAQLLNRIYHEVLKCLS